VLHKVYLFKDFLDKVGPNLLTLAWDKVILLGENLFAKLLIAGNAEHELLKILGYLVLDYSEVFGVKSNFTNDGPLDDVETTLYA